MQLGEEGRKKSKVRTVGKRRRANEKRNGGQELGGEERFQTGKIIYFLLLKRKKERLSGEMDRQK